MLERATEPLSRSASLRALGVLLSAAVLCAAPLGCGGSASKPSATRSTSTQTSTTTATAAATTTTTAPTQSQSSGTSSVSTGPVRGTLRGENHAPKVNRAWRYSVTVTDASGHPLNGTVDIEFAFGGQVVGHDTPPSHPIVNGRWHDSLKFPADAVGQPLSVQAVVHTASGSITLDWAITVKQ
jgi:hypothetical protein